MADLADYHWLTGNEAEHWLNEFAVDDTPVHRQLSQLRRSLTAERARLVVSQTSLRRRAVAKFNDWAAKMFFSELSLQQATDLQTAQYKASRVGDSSVRVADYCCGIGGDLLAFAQRNPTTGWERAPEIAHFAAENLRRLQPQGNGEVYLGSAEHQRPSPDEIWHLDPDRRVNGRRSTQLRWHSPQPELVDQWLAASPQGILKLAPATVVPEAWAREAELEWISKDRQCRQQIVWFGGCADSAGQRRATVVQSLPTVTEAIASTSFIGNPHCQADLATNIARYLYDCDPAIRASHLTDALALEYDLNTLNRSGGYLTSDKRIEYPLLARFEVRDLLPLRANVLIKHLRSLGIGQLEIKKRGVKTDPEQLRKRLKLRGSQSATLLLTRLGTSEIAVLAHRDQG